MPNTTTETAPTEAPIERDPTHEGLRAALLNGQPGLIRQLVASGFVRSRWEAQIATLGRPLVFNHDEGGAFNLPEGPVVAMYHPSIGPELARLAIGAPVNLARRASDLHRMHWTPNHRALAGSHPAVTVGLIEDAWVAGDRVMATLALWAEHGHRDLVDLEQRGALAFAGACMMSEQDYVLQRTPWSLVVATIIAPRQVYSLDLVSLPRDTAAHVRRRLDGDEVPPRGAPPAAVPAWPWGLDDVVGESLASGQARIAPGAVTTTELGTNAASRTLSTLMGVVSGTGSDGETDIPDGAITITTTGGPIMCIASIPVIYVNGTAGPSSQIVSVTARLYRGASLLNNYQVGSRMTNASDEETADTIAVVHMDTSGAGTYTFKLTLQVSGSTDDAHAELDSAAGIFQVTEFKR